MKTAILFSNAPLAIRIHAARMWMKDKGSELNLYRFVANHGPESSFVATGSNDPRADVTIFQGLTPQQAFAIAKFYDAKDPKNVTIEEIDLAPQIPSLEIDRRAAQGITAPPQPARFLETSSASRPGAFLPASSSLSRVEALTRTLSVRADENPVPEFVFVPRTAPQISVKLKQYRAQIVAGEQLKVIDLSGENVTDADVNDLARLIAANNTRDSLEELNLADTLIQGPRPFDLPNMRVLNVSGCVNLRWFNMMNGPALEHIDASNCPSLDLDTTDLGQIFRCCNALDVQNCNFSASGLSQSTKSIIDWGRNKGSFRTPRNADVPRPCFGV